MQCNLAIRHSPATVVSSERASEAGDEATTDPISSTAPVEAETVLDAGSVKDSDYEISARSNLDERCGVFSDERG